MVNGKILDTHIPEDSRQTKENTNVPHHEPFNLLDPGLSQNDKIPEKIKNDHKDEKAEDESKMMPQNNENDKKTKESKDESKMMPQNNENDKKTKESKDETKPRGQSDYYLTVLDRIRADKKNKEEKIKVICKEMGFSRKNAEYILDKPENNPELARTIGIRFAEPQESDHQVAAELRIDPKEVAYMRTNESKNLQDLLNQKEIVKAQEILRRRSPSPVKDPRQAILDMDPRPPHLKDMAPNEVAQLAEYQDQVPDIVLDASGFPACMPPEIRQKRREIGLFQAEFNADWAHMVLRSKIDPLKAILMKMNPSQTTFPEINTGRHTSVESVLKLVESLDPAMCEILAHNPSLINNRNFDMCRDSQEKFFKRIVEAEDAEHGLHPNMTPELRQKRVEIAGFQMKFDRDWAKNVYKVRHNPLRMILTRFNPALQKANALPGLPLKVDDRVFFDNFPDVDRIVEFVQNLDPTKVEILANNPHLFDNPSFNINRDPDEMNFEDREATRRSIGNQLLMVQAEARRMNEEGSTPVPTQEPPKLPPNGEPPKLPPNGELPPMTPKNGIPKGLLSPLTPKSEVSSSRNSLASPAPLGPISSGRHSSTSPAPLGPIRRRGPPAEPAQSGPGLGPMPSSCGKNPFPQPGIPKPAPGSLVAAGGSNPLGSAKPRPGPSAPTGGSRPLAETGNAKPTTRPFGGSKALGPIGGCKSTPETGHRKDPFGSPVGKDKPRKSSLGPLAPIGVLSKDMNSTTSTFGPMKHPLFD